MDSNSRIKAVVSNTSTLSISIVVQPAPSTPNMPNRPSKPPPTSDNHHRPNTSKQEYEVPIVAQPENYIAQDVEFYNAPKFSDMINAETNIAVVGKSEFKFQAVSQFTTPTAIPIVPNNIKVPQPTTPTSILIVPNNPKKHAYAASEGKKKNANDCYHLSPKDAAVFISLLTLALTIIHFIFILSYLPNTKYIAYAHCAVSIILVLGHSIVGISSFQNSDLPYVLYFFFSREYMSSVYRMLSYTHIGYMIVYGGVSLLKSTQLTEYLQIQPGIVVGFFVLHLVCGICLYIAGYVYSRLKIPYRITSDMVDTADTLA